VAYLDAADNGRAAGKAAQVTAAVVMEAEALNVRTEASLYFSRYAGRDPLDVDQYALSSAADFVSNVSLLKHFPYCLLQLMLWSR
jgi:hypothetical protein